MALQTLLWLVAAAFATGHVGVAMRAPRAGVLHGRSPPAAAAARSRPPSRVSLSSVSQSAADESPGAVAADINALTTELNDAIEREDFAAAARFRDQIAACAGQAAALDGWVALGTPEWLAERAERLGYRVPTPVQRRAFRTLTAADTVIRSQTGSGKTLAYLMPVLSALSDDLLEEDMTSYLSTYLGGDGGGGPSRSEATPRGGREQQRDGPLVVIVVATRELGVQVSMLAYQLCGGNRNPVIQPFAHPRRFEPGAMTNMFKCAPPSPSALPCPCLPACRAACAGPAWVPCSSAPRRSTGALPPERARPGPAPHTLAPGALPRLLARARYTGPRHVKIAGVWDKDSLNSSMPVSDFGLDSLRGCHIVVGTPECLAAVARRGHVPLHEARFTVVDEADACMRAQRGAAGGGGALADVLRRPPQEAAGAAGARAERAGDGGALRSNPWRKALPERRVLVGASITPPEVSDAVARGWLAEDASLIVEEGVLEGGAKSASWEGEQQRVPPGLAHNFVRVDKKGALGALVRLIRKELLDWEEYERTAGALGLGAGGAGPRTRPRMIVFCESADTAVAVASPLQSTLWSGLGGDIDAGLCGLSVLLPSAEDRLEMSKEDESVAKVQESSLRVLEMFAIESTNLLITTVGATRGLDFPNVTHVFNLGVVGEPTDYLHRAGRAGRIGHRVRGVVTSVVDADGVRELQALGARLGFEPREVELPLRSEYASVAESSSKEEQVRYLEDILQLYSRGEPAGGDEDRAGPE